MNNAFQTHHHHVDFCVVGGGLAGLCAAVAAARHGAKVALMQERPMLGGNASSEVRMWVCGAHGRDNRETGLVEELMLENLYRNPDYNYSVWDGILYELAAYQENLTLLLNCTCNDCAMEGSRIVSVTGWQMTTQSYHTVHAALFADCSGDSVLAPLTGALTRWGRESREEFGEDIAPAAADRRTMGMSCMIQARQEMRPSTFIPPKWAHKYTRADLPHRLPDMDNPMENFWYLELGGEYDAIADTEWLRDELLRMAYGIWDFVKNDPELKEKNANWRLDWVGILPGKRESRRYVGDHILTQHDVRAGGHFDDLVAYGGWSMDDHHPGGFRSPEQPTIYHPSPSPYGIPYRCLYSANIDNLFCAGRNISVTHTAMSSTRVMATCATLGQAVGTAAAIAALYGLTPRGVYEQRIAELQQTLMDDDCYLPFRRRAIPAITRNAALACDSPDAENLRNGLDRALDGAYNGVAVPLGSAIAYTFPAPEPISRVRVVLDSDLNRDTLPECERRRERNMLHNRPLGWPDAYVPTTLLRAFRIEGVRPDGTAETLYESQDNHRRLISVPVDGVYAAVRLLPLTTWGDPLARIFSFDVC
ncbi:MAG: FAD-dependent oxidoreductase [Candidatus Spyradocola sp.]|nr:FAD-dependent oxidoreductase [Candidatus Spyradocola sp.]